MESQYLKPIFKSGRTTIDIWRAIALELKGPVHFLQKKKCVKSDVYVHQILKDLQLLFYEKYIQERRHMIWIDNSASYYTSKTTTKCMSQI